mmetsp:Transcript_115175/g.229410  ORF Transcript_115175/g.229410 Transcript_115175/m.229410 type:complete len:206 (+) Transcript_115175:257-874(+)
MLSSQSCVKWLHCRSTVQCLEPSLAPLQFRSLGAGAETLQLRFGENVELDNHHEFGSVLLVYCLELWEFGSPYLWPCIGGLADGGFGLHQDLELSETSDGTSDSLWLQAAPTLADMNPPNPRSVASAGGCQNLSSSPGQGFLYSDVWGTPGISLEYDREENRESPQSLRAVGRFAEGRFSFGTTGCDAIDYSPALQTYLKSSVSP